MTRNEMNSELNTSRTQKLINTTRRRGDGEPCEVDVNLLVLGRSNRPGGFKTWALGTVPMYAVQHGVDDDDDDDDDDMMMTKRNHHRSLPPQTNKQMTSTRGVCEHILPAFLIEDITTIGRFHTLRTLRRRQLPGAGGEPAGWTPE